MSAQNADIKIINAPKQTWTKVFVILLFLGNSYCFVFSLIFFLGFGYSRSSFVLEILADIEVFLLCSPS